MAATTTKIITDYSWNSLAEYTGTQQKFIDANQAKPISDAIAAKVSNLTTPVVPVTSPQALKVAYNAQGQVTSSSMLAKADIALGNVPNEDWKVTALLVADDATTDDLTMITGAQSGSLPTLFNVLRRRVNSLVSTVKAYLVDSFTVDTGGNTSSMPSASLNVGLTIHLSQLWSRVRYLFTVVQSYLTSSFDVITTGIDNTIPASPLSETLTGHFNSLWKRVGFLVEEFNLQNSYKPVPYIWSSLTDADVKFNVTGLRISDSLVLVNFLGTVNPGQSFCTAGYEKLLELNQYPPTSWVPENFKFFGYAVPSSGNTVSDLKIFTMEFSYSDDPSRTHSIYMRGALITSTATFIPFSFVCSKHFLPGDFRNLLEIY